MNFALKTRSFVSKTKGFKFKMMNFAEEGEDEFAALGGAFVLLFCTEDDDFMLTK